MPPPQAPLLPPPGDLARPPTLAAALPKRRRGRPTAGPAAPMQTHALLQRIAAEFERLSPQLRAVARYVEHHHDCVGQARIQEVAQRCQVQPSTVVRFAQRFGLSGFEALRQALGAGARTRLPALPPTGDTPAAGQALAAVDQAHASLAASLAGLQQLQRDLHLSRLADATALLRQARVLWVTGSQRGFAVAAHLAWALQQGPQPVQFLSLMGGLLGGPLRGVRPGDVMLAVALGPLPADTLEAAQQACARGARLVLLCDGPTPALATEAAVCLQVEEPAPGGHPGVCNSLATAQALCLAWAGPP
ncbi:MurR/RpiR family transcriptional regulator [Ideonella livida]|uniref:MurR/RpiR family transcriptional regulator n=1 Tax=Ideonella livida TaxID=2707176 RepID=A0A7C9PKP1_9BURK|nr:MurR/RpiR family transcriptional regulator [Ideonella livida]NDY93751.1 MurR/RpiR family transcriptional regulator [Ideonella livida]